MSDYDLPSIEKNYREMTTQKLIHLTEKPEELRREVIPVLQKELLQRGENEAALSLTHYLARPSLQHLSPEDLQDLVASRLQTGESIESIKLDLKDQGINIFDVLNKEAKQQDKALDYISSLKARGAGDEEINQKLQENFEMGEDESETLKHQLRQRGTLNIVIGTVISSLTLIGILLYFASGRIPSFGPLLILGFGIWRIIVGYDQRK